MKTAFSRARGLNIGVVFLALILLLPESGWASYGQSICGKKDLACIFLVIFLYLGLFGGIPVACVLFAFIHGLFSHRDRSKGKQVLIGIAAGLVAFALSAFAAAVASVVTGGGPGSYNYLLWSFIATALVCAGVSALYASSAPGTFSVRKRSIRRD